MKLTETQKALLVGGVLHGFIDTGKLAGDTCSNCGEGGSGLLGTAEPA